MCSIPVPPAWVFLCAVAYAVRCNLTYCLPTGCLLTDVVFAVLKTLAAGLATVLIMFAFCAYHKDESLEEGDRREEAEAEAERVKMNLKPN